MIFSKSALCKSADYMQIRALESESIGMFCFVRERSTHASDFRGYVINCSWDAVGARQVLMSNQLAFLLVRIGPTQ